MNALLIQIKFSQWTYHSYHSFFKVVVDNWLFTTISWKVPDIHSVTQITWTVISGFLLIKEKHWGSYLMISTWSLGKSRLKLIKMRKLKQGSWWNSVRTIALFCPIFWKELPFFVEVFYKLWLISVMEWVRSAWWSARKCSDMLVGLSTNWSVVFVEAIFGSSLCFSYISFDIVCWANSVESES